MISLLFVFIVIMAIVIIVTKKDKKQECEITSTRTDGSSTKKIDRVGRIFNIVLSILYVPISWLSGLSLMASEATINATNHTFIILISVFCWVAILIPFLCFLGIFLSVILRKKGYSIWSFIVQFIPLIIFGLNVLLLFIAESLPVIK